MGHKLFVLDGFIFIFPDKEVLFYDYLFVSPFVNLFVNQQDYTNITGWIFLKSRKVLVQLSSC